MAPPIAFVLALILCGIGASFFGSIVGLGGGFIAVPVLRLAFGLAPAHAAAASLLLVFASSASAGMRYSRQGRVAWNIVVPVALATVPGSIAGALVSAHTSAASFDISYGVFLTLVAIDVGRQALTTKPSALAVPRGVRPTRWILIPAGLAIGFVSSLFGIGGGVLIIPLLLFATSEDIHTIVATSTAIIACAAPAGILTQALQHQLPYAPALALAAGGVAGGTAGATLSNRISSRQLSLFLAVAMIAAAAGMALRHFF